MSEKRMEAAKWWHTEITDKEKKRLMEEVLDFPGRDSRTATGREIQICHDYEKNSR